MQWSGLAKLNCWCMGAQITMPRGWNSGLWEPEISLIDTIFRPMCDAAQCRVFDDVDVTMCSCVKEHRDNNGGILLV